MAIQVFFVLLSFTAGSLPLSLWIGRIFLGKDIREVGDGNPGATNVFRSGGKISGLLALFLDITKAALPVGLAYRELGINGPILFLIAVSPTFGHMFSPFLQWKGGKGVATILGVWIGLSIWKASFPAAAGAALGSLIFANSAWAVMMGLVFIFASLVWLGAEPLFFLIWIAQVLILAWSHREDLRQPPHLRLCGRE